MTNRIGARQGRIASSARENGVLQILTSIIAIPFAGAVAALFLPARWAGRIALVPPAFVLALVLPRWSNVAGGMTTIVPIAWFPSLQITASLRFDYLGAFFAVLVAGVGLGIVQYSRVYLGPKASPRYWAAVLAFMGAMLGIVLSDSLILLFVFWELTTITSALLIGMEFEQAAARNGAISALLVTGFGGLCLLAGVVLLGQMFDSYSLSQLQTNADQIVATPAHVLPLLLLLAGAFTKSAQFPFHFWLPNAMAAPPPISAYLHSATMVKAGVFLLGRLFPIFGASAIWQPILLTIGFTTFLVGGWDAILARDLKKLLAYSTVANLGLLTALYGLYPPGAYVRGELLNIANHALYKSALFLLVGWMEKVTGTRDLSILRYEHWFQREPAGGILVGIGALAMGGAPFLLGFMTKEALFEAILLEPMPIIIVAAAAAIAGGAMALAYALKLFVSSFWGPMSPPEDRGYPRQELSPWLLIVPAILLLPQIIGGIAPGWFIGRVLEPGTIWPAWIAIWHHVDALFALSILTLMLGIVGYLVWRRLSPLPTPPRTQLAFARAADATLAAAGWFSRAIQAGGHPRYLSVTLLFAAVASAAVAASNGVSNWVADEQAAKPGAAWLPAIITAAGAVLTLFMRNRAAKLIMLATAGYGIALFYVAFRAPDLALTQILVETISLVLLLLALRRLPRLERDERTWAARAGHGFVAAVAGLGLSALAWFSGIHQVGDSAGNEQLARSLPEAHGRNVVNAILVDFRGADTLGEISVLVIAAIGIIALVPVIRGLSADGRGKQS